jgi:hypothetical protein
MNCYAIVDSLGNPQPGTLADRQKSAWTGFLIRTDGCVSVITRDERIKHYTTEGYRLAKCRVEVVEEGM